MPDRDLHSTSPAITTQCIKPSFKLVKHLESKFYVHHDFQKDSTGKAICYCLSTTEGILKGLTVSKQLYGMVYAVSGCKSR